MNNNTEFVSDSTFEVRLRGKIHYRDDPAISCVHFRQPCFGVLDMRRRTSHRLKPGNRGSCHDPRGSHQVERTGATGCISGVVSALDASDQDRGHRQAQRVAHRKGCELFADRPMDRGSSGR